MVPPARSPQGPASSPPSRALPLAAGRGISPRRFGATARRIAFAVVVTALLPFGAALAVGRVTIDRLAALAVQPELGVALEQSLGVYADLAGALKDGMRHEAAAMAANRALLAAAAEADGASASAALRALASQHPRVASLAVQPAGGDPLASFAAPPSKDASAFKQLSVVTPIEGTAYELVAVLSTPSARFAEQERLAAFERAYRELEGARRSAYVERPYLLALTGIMLLTILVAVLAGFLVARPVTRGVGRLVLALEPVAAGDLVPRVRFDADDELGALGRTFNTAIEELGQSRARVEFLRQMAEWQKVARRLAHEIRNPLTPIQLAVQECQRRYDGRDPAFERLLSTTVEVVEEEIASLRRLVGRFSRFARLPDPELQPCDLAELLREQASHLALTHGASTTTLDDEDAVLVGVDLAFEVPEGPLPARVDREMLHRALLNLLRNAAQALREGRGREAAPAGKIRVRAGEDAEGVWLAVDDDGPGIAPEIRDSLFDPYVTTRAEGTGLGLSIVKKIALDHGGRIEAASSPEGGARIVLRLPRPDAAG